MKKVIVFVLIACMLFSAVGCSALSETASLLKPTETVFSIDSYHLQITADSSFYDKTGGSYDLQITNGKAYISIMAYQYIDLPEGTTPQDVYTVQNEDLFSRRTAVTTVEETKTQTHSDQVITYAMYSAEKDGIKNYYATYLVDLPNDEALAWVLITATPSYLDNNREYLHNIVCSLTSSR